MTSISTGSLPPMLPEQMSSILGDSSAVQALGGAGLTTAAPTTAGAFLDLSPNAVQLTSGEQVEMAQLSDDAALFGGSVGASAFSQIPAPAAPPAPPLYDPTQDVANPSYADPGATALDWSQDPANPSYST
jgi:hypothetical protein